MTRLGVDIYNQSETRLELSVCIVFSDWTIDGKSLNETIIIVINLYYQYTK